ncbi:MAG: hypothetical protein AMXMBFR44_6880 [Candidatus Campbellbacteria bacterium]
MLPIICDTRYGTVTTLKKRKVIWNEFRAALDKKEREKREARREQDKAAFYKLLEETEDITYKTEFSEIKVRIVCG